MRAGCGLAARRNASDRAQSVALTTPSCVPRRRGANSIELRGDRASARRKLEGARTRPPTTHALRPIACVAARCQPAPCSHPPPSEFRPPRSTGCYPRRHHARRHRTASRSPAPRSAPPRSLAPTSVGIMRDGSSLGAVELPPLSADVRAPRGSSFGSRTHSRAYAGLSWQPCALLLSCGSAACTSSQLAQLHARRLHSWLSRMHAVSACSVACTPSQLTPQYVLAA